MTSPLYLLLLAGGLSFGLWYWLGQAKKDPRLPLIYFGGLGGAFLGAKLAYLLAEGWLWLDHPQRWLLWASGKSIMGALPGGWLGVEITKKFLAYPQPTSDHFALLLPPALAAGRLGCLHARCCPGILLPSGNHWPAVPVEIAFQLLSLLLLWVLRRQPWARHQLFFLYLATYSLFRFFHEFLRPTPKLLSHPPLTALSGYQLLAALTFCYALLAYHHRSRPPLTP